MLVLSGAALFGWALWEEAGPRKTSVWQGLVIVPFWMAFLMAGALLGSVILPAISAAAGWPSGDWRGPTGPLGFVAGAWGAAIGTQVINNWARRILGKPAMKIEWYRKSIRRRRKKAAAGRTGAH